jgi:hypothetical protein
MPPKKGTYTPNKPPDSPTWTLDEGEEICRDIVTPCFPWSINITLLARNYGKLKV